MGFPVVRQDERGMSLFSINTTDNHYMLLVVPAREGAAKPGSDQVGMRRVCFELGGFTVLQDAFRRRKEAGAKVREGTFHCVTKSTFYEDPDGTRLEIYCNVPAGKCARSVPIPYSRLAGIEAVRSGWTRLSPVISNSRAGEIMAWATLGACRECLKWIVKNDSSSN